MDGSKDDTFFQHMKEKGGGAGDSDVDAAEVLKVMQKGGRPATKWKAAAHRAIDHEWEKSLTTYLTHVREAVELLEALVKKENLADNPEQSYKYLTAWCATHHHLGASEMVDALHGKGVADPQPAKVGGGEDYYANHSGTIAKQLRDNERTGDTLPDEVRAVRLHQLSLAESFSKAQRNRPNELAGKVRDRADGVICLCAWTLTPPRA